MEKRIPRDPFWSAVVSRLVSLSLLRLMAEGSVHDGILFLGKARNGEEVLIVSMVGRVVGSRLEKITNMNLSTLPT